MVELFTYENLFPPNFNWWQPETNPHRTQIESPWDRWSPAVVAAVEGAKNIVIQCHANISTNDIIAIPHGMAINFTSTIGTILCIDMEHLYGNYYTYLASKMNTPANRDYHKKVKLKNPEKVKQLENIITYESDIYSKKGLFPIDQQDIIVDFITKFPRDYILKNKVDMQYTFHYNLVYAPDLTTKFKSKNIIPDVYFSTKKEVHYIYTNIVFRIIKKNKWEYTDIIFTDIQKIKLSNILAKIYQFNKDINITVSSCLPFKVNHNQPPVWTNCFDYLSPYFQTIDKKRRRASFKTDIVHTRRLLELDTEIEGNIKNLMSIEKQFQSIDFETFTRNFLRLFPKIMDQNYFKDDKLFIWYKVYRYHLEQYNPHKLFVLKTYWTNDETSMYYQEITPCLIILLWNYRVGQGKYLLFNIPKMLRELPFKEKEQPLKLLLETLQQAFQQRALPSNCKEIIKKRNKLIAKIKYG